MNKLQETRLRKVIRNEIKNVLKESPRYVEEDYYTFTASGKKLIKGIEALHKSSKFLSDFAQKHPEDSIQFMSDFNSEHDSKVPFDIGSLSDYKNPADLMDWLIKNKYIEEYDGDGTDY